MSKKELLNQLGEYGITHVAYCSCGAYTFTINGQDYSVHNRSVTKFFPKINRKDLHKAIESRYSNCNWCINQWGLDLCACGSGEKLNKCNNGYSMCGKPMQVVGKYDHFCC